MSRVRSATPAGVLPALLRRVCASLLCIQLLGAFASAGQLFPAWRLLYDNATDVGQAHSQYAGGIAVDDRGNVAVCGYLFNAADRATFYVAKYEGLHGGLIWEQMLNPGNAGAYATSVAIDSAGNVIATGYYETANGDDYITYKLSAATGDPVWSSVNGLQARTYDGTAGGADEAVKVVVDSNDNVIVTGKSVGAGATNYDIYTVKYNSAGTFVWERRYNYFVNGSGNREDIPTSIALDAANNVFVAGLADRSGADSLFYIAKYNASSGVPIWTKTDDNGGLKGLGATSLAVDFNGDAVVCGPAYHSDGTHDIKTIKYLGTNGGFAWAQPQIYATQSFHNNWCGVAVDSEGNVSVVGTSEAGTGSTGQRIYTARYTVAGAFVWERYSPAPANFDEDTARGIVVDGSSNTVVFGESEPADTSTVPQGLYIGRYAPADGEPVFELRFDDLETSFQEDAQHVSLTPQIAFSNLGGLALVGNYVKPAATSGAVRHVGFSPIKFNRFIIETGDEAGDGKISKLGTPAVADNGSIAARVTIANKKGKSDAILTQGITGAPALPAVQGDAAPGITDAKFKSFLDPIISQTGKIAFVAKLTGVPSSESTAVFTNAQTGTLTAALQQGKEIFSLTGTKLKSISSISLNSVTGDELIALTKVSGEFAGDPVTKDSDTVLLGLNSGGVTPLLRTGQMLAVGGLDPSAIKSITVLTPPKGSAGHGRWESASRVVARVTLADKRTVVVSVTEGGSPTALLFTDGDATLAASEAKWKTFGLPGTASGTVGQFVTAGITTDSDVALLYGTGDTITTALAVTGKPAAGVSGASYDGFLDPVVNSNGQVAFIGTLKGKDVKSNDKSAIWFGSPAPSLLVRQGDAVLEGDVDTDTKWVSFQSLALPNGSGAGPIFLAKIAGRGVSKKNSSGLWALDSIGKIRELLRVGDNLGGNIVTRMTLLQGLPSVAGATRSFNGKGSVGVLLSFKGGGQAIYPIGIP